MDELQRCAQIFSELLNRDYLLTLENGVVLRIFFEKKHFKHLLGLHKLKDLDAFHPKRGLSAKKVYAMVLEGKLTMHKIKKSAFYPLIQDRIQEFLFIKNVFQKKIVVDFDPTRLESCKLEAEYILYTQHKDGYIHLTIGNDFGHQYPESFFFERTNYYLSGQTLLEVVKLEIIDRKK